MARRKAQNPYGSCLAARGRLPAARQSQRPADALFRAPAAFSGTALLSSGPSRIECADRSVSQLLAGTPSGPGGSSDAARVPRCDEARRRRTSSRLTTPHDRAPQWTRWVQSKRGSGGGDYAGTTHPLSSSRRKPGSRAARTRASELWIPAFAGMTELGSRLRQPSLSRLLKPLASPNGIGALCGRGRDKLRPAAHRARRAANQARRDRRDRAADPRPLDAA